MPEPRPRKPRFRRIKPATPLHLTERDFLILRQVSVHRFLRSDHIVALLDGSSQHLVRRLGRLYHGGYLERPRQQRRLGIDETRLKPDAAGPRYQLATSRLSR